SQMRRAAVSIPSNIAEGYKRRNLGEYIQFLSIADASAAELETQAIIAKELYSNVDLALAEPLLEEVQKMLIVMIKKLSANR
ncbi:MAG: four helix bundle protein, partial [Candidatus Shapirobacteria bacterium]